MCYDSRHMEVSPVQYPTITVDGKPLEVKFRLGDLLRLKKNEEIDLIDGAEVLKLKNSEAMVRSLTMLSYGLAHIGKYTAEQLADSFTLSDISLISDVLTKALSLVPAQAKTQEAPTPIQ